jgi:preprotein translocase subunit SecA
MLMLQLIDQQWKDHLLSMDHLKEGISLRGYGQKDPLIEYKKESFVLFQEMLQRFDEETLKFLFHLQPKLSPDGGTGSGPGSPGASPVRQPPAFTPRDGNGAAEAEAEPAPAPVPDSSIEDFTRDIRRKKERELEQVKMAGGGDGSASTVKQVIKGDKIGRNDPCPCGSGKKYKKCCGADA